MNRRFQIYLESLTPAKKMLAQEAVGEYLKGDAESIEIMDSPMAIFKQVRHLALEEDEHAVVVLMKNNFRLLKTVTIATGCVTCCFFDTRKVIREAIVNNATAIALAHNHPSGSIIPSREDDNVTKQISEACKLMHINLTDHIIVGDGNYYSFKENGRL